MKKLIIVIGVVLLYTACDQNKVPKGVIERKQMLNVMVDMQLTDAYLNQIYNPDTMKMQAHSRYNYIFKKFKIDSAKFSNSLKYYSKNPTVLDSMYSQVSDSLTRLQEQLKPKLKPIDNDGTAEIQAYNYMFGKFRTDSSKHTSNLNYYTLNAKELYGKYTQTLDSLVNLQDSLDLKPKKLQEIKKFRKAKSEE